MRVAYLGPEGTFSHEALLTCGGLDGATGVECATVYDAALAIHAGTADRALVPIENSLEGAVNATLDALAFAAPDTVIVGELVHGIHLCLMARAPLAIGDVEVVLSHPQPSGQCAGYLREHLPRARVIAATSTAEAVRSLAGDEPERPAWSRRAAAIGTRAAAERYGATILAAGIEDDPSNETRFVWLAPRPAGAPAPVPDGPAKTSIVFWGDGTDAPGWLVRCLSEFAFRGVNLTRIESRPRRDRLGSYVFFLDMDGHVSAGPIGDAVAALASQTEVVRVLGSYPAARP